MIHLPDAKLEQVMDRFRMIEARMESATDGTEIVKLSKEHAEIKPVYDAVTKLHKARQSVPDLEEMAALNDPDLSPLAVEELAELKVTLPELEHGVALLLAPQDKDVNASAIWKSVLAPAATKPLSSPAICSACIAAMPHHRAGRSKSIASQKAKWEATKKSSPQ